MSKRNQLPVKKNQIPIYVGAFIFATFLWLLEKLEKTQTGVYEIRLCYPDATLHPWQKIVLHVEASGYTHLRMSQKLPEQIEALQWAFEEPTQWLQRYLSPKDFRLLFVEPHPQELRKSLGPIHKLPVQFRSRLITPAEVEVLSPPILVPESVYALNGFNPQWEGTLVLTKDTTYELDLSSSCAFYPNKIQVFVSAEKVIIGSVKISPHIIGPWPKDWELYPKQVTLQYKIPASSPYLPKPQDFELQVDARKITPMDTVVYPVLVRAPKGLKQIHWSPDYLRIKRVYYK